MTAFASLFVFVLFLLVVIQGLQQIPITEQRRRLSSNFAQWPIDSSVSFTGTTTTASASVNPVSSLAGLQIGMTVTGLDIPANTTIIALSTTAGGTITLSANATTGHATTPLVATFTTGTAQIHLYAAPYGGGADPTPASFTEATFDTYAALDVTVLAGPYSNPDGSAEADLGLFSWVLTTTPTTTNLIYGYWIDYIAPLGGATRVVSVWENFPTPLPMNSAGNAVVCTVPMKLPLPGTVVQP